MFIFFLLLLFLLFFVGLGDGCDLMQDEEAVDDLAGPGGVFSGLEHAPHCGLAKLLEFLVLDYAAEGEHDFSSAVEGGGKGLKGFYHLVEYLHYVDYLQGRRLALWLWLGLSLDLSWVFLFFLGLSYLFKGLIGQLPD